MSMTIITAFAISSAVLKPRQTHQAQPQPRTSQTPPLI